MEDRKKVDVVIPTYKPGKKFSRLLKMLQRQTWPVGKIIVMNTEKSFWNEHGFEGIKNLEVHHLTKEERPETEECASAGQTLWYL